MEMMRPGEEAGAVLSIEQVDGVGGGPHKRRKTEDGEDYDEDDDEDDDGELDAELEMCTQQSLEHYVCLASCLILSSATISYETF
jgi:hypothetical protein